MRNNKKESIIESFQKMDWDMLAVFLDNNKTYQNATKEVFLEKLNAAFSELKENGDTFLLPHKGFCNFDKCPNKGCKGYSFVGNMSNKHIDLIFDELEDNIKDIYHCNDFKTNDKTVKIKSLIGIDIMNDERADFKPSIDFLNKSQKCKLAYDELIQYQNTVIGKEVYLVWLEKFYLLKESLNLQAFNYAGFDKFYWLYSRIEELKHYLQSDDFVKEALKEFQSIEKNNEPKLLKWLAKYEKTGDDLVMLLYLFEEIDFENLEDNAYFIVDGLKIKTLDFKCLAKFRFLFDNHYWNMLEKYTTFTKEETTHHMNANNKMSNYINSLSYHLEKRGIDL